MTAAQSLGALTLMNLQRFQYNDDDLLALQAALAAWIQAAGDCGYYHIGNLPHWIYAVLRGRRPAGELVQIWRDDGAVAAIALCRLFGTAFQAFVRPDLRGSAAEMMILTTAEAITRETAGSPGNQPVVTDVVSCDTTRAKLLEDLGFMRYRVWDHILERDLARPLGEPHLPQGFAIRAATRADAAPLALARNDAFDGEWTAEEYRAEVMDKPGYEAERELVAIAPDGALAAFCVIWLDPLNHVGLFEPVGTVRAFQRRGLGRALMLAAMNIMRQHGMLTALVQHDAANQAAGQLYASLGFQKKYETLGYQR